MKSVNRKDLAVASYEPVQEAPPSLIPSSPPPRQVPSPTFRPFPASLRKRVHRRIRHSPASLERARTEDRHWRFTGRRALLEAILGRLALPPAAAILEVGCGTGGNLPLLARYGRVAGMEMDEAARTLAAHRTGRNVAVSEGGCPDRLGPQGRRFDLICLFDRMETGREAETMAALGPLLADRGRLLLTLPARQLDPGGLREKAAGAGLKVARLTYFNTLLYPVAVLERLVALLPGRAGRPMPAAPLNWLLGRVMAAERHLLDRADLPFGASVLCVLEPAGEGRKSAE